MGELSTLRLHQPAGGAADPVTVRDLKALQDNVRAVVDPLVKVLQAAGGVYLPLAGGTMAGAIAMGANKITGLAAASANGDALRYEQLLGVVTAAELGYLAGVTSGIQAQIDALGAGIAQSVYGQSLTDTANNTATYVDYLTQAFTPLSASSKIIVLAEMAGGVTTVGSSTTTMEAQLLRDAVVLQESKTMQSSTAAANATHMGDLAWMFMESSPGVSAVTYKLQFRRQAGNANVQANFASLLILEIL